MKNSLQKHLKTILAAMLLLVATACSSKTVIDDSLPELLAPKPGLAKLVVYSPRSFIWSGSTASIGLGAGTSCRLHSGTFAVYNVTPGIMTLTASLCNGTGTSAVKIPIEAGNKYYVRITPNDRSVAGLIAGYGARTTGNKPKSEAEITKNQSLKEKHIRSGTFVIEIVDEQPALEQLTTLQMLTE